MCYRRKTWGESSLVVARSIIGWGEEGANNHGPDLDVLRFGRKLRPWHSGAWCAEAVYYEIVQAWALRRGYDGWLDVPISERREMPIAWTPSARKLGRRIAKAGRYVDENDIRPGDFVVYPRKGGSHIAIVSWVCGNEYRTIDGNKGRFNKRTKQGAKVREFNHEKGEPVRFFCRLPS